MRSYYKAYKKVGEIKTSLAEKLGVMCYGYVYISPGVIRHIIRRHNKQLSRNVKDNLINVIESILKDPDYIGTKIKENNRIAIEFAKKVDSILLLGMEVDKDEGYIYVSTLYPITKSKIDNKIYGGKLLSCSIEQLDT